MDGDANAPHVVHIRTKERLASLGVCELNRPVGRMIINLVRFALAHALMAERGFDIVVTHMYPLTVDVLFL